MIRKKILFIHETFNGGGAEKVFVDLIRKFDTSRYDVSLLLLYGGGIYDNALPPGVHVTTLYPHRSLIHKVRNHFLSSRLAMFRHDVNRALGQACYDVIISFLEGPAMRVHSMVMDRAPRNISWVHVNLMINHWSSFMFKNVAEEAALYARMDELVFVSEGAKEAFIDRFGPSGVRKHVIPNVIDRDAISARSQEHQIPKTRFTIINVGRLEAQKNHNRLLEAAAKIKATGLDFEIWLVGSGSLENELRRKVEALGLKDNILFKGFQSNPYIYMAAADLFLLTSDTEGWPTVICEAMSLGLPVVSTKVTGAEELLSDDAGILTSSDPAEISAAVCRLADDRALLARYAARSAERSRIFKPSEVLARIYELIEGR